MSFPEDPSGAGTPPGKTAPPTFPPAEFTGDAAVGAAPVAPVPSHDTPVTDWEHPAGDLGDFDHGPGSLPGQGSPVPPEDFPETPDVPAAPVAEAPEAELAATGESGGGQVGLNAADFEHGPGPLPGDVLTHPVSDFDHPVGDLSDFEHGPGSLPGSEFEHPTGADPWWTSQGASEASTEAVEASSTFVPTATDHEPLPIHKAETSLMAAGSPPKPPRPPEPPEEEDEEEDGMAQMSFMEHLEELRKRILLGVGGVGVAFALSLIFSDELWAFVFAPAGAALKALHVEPPELIQISPTDAFQIMWMKLPILAAIFLSSPWILYQVWSFIAPGLYKKERRYAAPFVISSAGLFILGGLFAYFVAFRFGLEFLLGLGIGKGVRPQISMNEYYDLFVDVMLGVGIVFEIPVLIFLLTLIRVANPVFLVRHSRYAIFVIVILAAFITPTGDVFNLALFATPMILLFYVGIFVSYLLVLKREKRRFPWGTFMKVLGIVLALLGLILWYAARYYGFHIVFQWPFLIK